MKWIGETGGTDAFSRRLAFREFQRERLSRARV